MKTIKDHHPIRPVTLHRDPSRQWGRHGIENGARDCPVLEHSAGCMPGFQRVMARCLSLGRLRIVFGL